MQLFATASFLGKICTVVLVYHSSALWIHIENLFLPRGLCSRVSCRSFQRLSTVACLVHHHIHHLPEIVPESHKHSQENHNENHQQVEQPHGTHQENTEGRKVELQHLAQTRKSVPRKSTQVQVKFTRQPFPESSKLFDNCFQEHPQIQVQFKLHGQQFQTTTKTKNKL